jgi:16S rRNA (cytosine1402-N4)-methyltransferase
MQTETHTPVLLQEVQTGLSVQEDDIVVDGTLGMGGHALVLAKMLSSKGIFVGIDQDEDAVRNARKTLGSIKAIMYFSVGNFRNIADTLGRFGLNGADKILFDLGWNRMQLTTGRGFSFKTDEPLLLTYEKNPGPEKLVGRDVVNTWSEADLANMFYGYGEERQSRKFARVIVQAREKKEIATARELADLIENALPKRHYRIHPATRVFQALRIVVNDELGALTDGIKAGIASLNPHGRLAVITFHSIEDREVKHLFKEYEKRELVRIITKKPITASREECLNNPPSRSAKLRILERV